MADGIGRLSGYGNYGVGGYMPQRRGDVSKEESVVVKKGRESPENILSNLNNELYTEKIILLESKQDLIILKKE